MLTYPEENINIHQSHIYQVDFCGLYTKGKLFGPTSYNAPMQET